MESLFAGVTTNPRFLYSAFYAYDNSRVTAFFEENGLPLKTERGNRVFPVSDHSSDVIAVLRRVLAQRGVTVRLHTGVAGLLTAPYAKPLEPLESGGSSQLIGACRKEDANVRESGGRQRAHGKKAAWQSAVCGVLLEDGTELPADAVILATGGLSYPSTGSTGDGYRFAEDAGHTVVTPAPSLVPFYAKEDYVTSLQGLSLRNVRVRIRDGKKLLFDEFGELLFTHFGVSGPLMLSASAVIPRSLIQKQLSMEIDLKPALDAEQLDARLLREFERAKNRQFKNAVASLFPAKLTPVMLLLGGVDPEKRVNEITREERQAFSRRVKAFPLTLAGPRGFDEAIITRGGVKTGEVNPSTMESKLVKDLYLCGELLDVDARTGGFNLQIAWSTGYLAGNSAGGGRTE